MKRGLVVITALVLILFTLQGCDKIVDDWEDHKDRETIYGSGRLVEVELDNSDFDMLVLTHVYSANITQGEEYSITLQVDDNIEQYVSVYQIGERLYFTLDNENNYNEVTLDIEMVVPHVNMLELSGATYAKLNDFSSDNTLSLYISGASSVMGNVDVKDLHAQLSGASTIYLTGSGEVVDVAVSGASYADLVNFMGLNGYVSMSGASNGKVNVEETLQVELSGTSQLWYAGNPQISIIEISGLAKLHRL